ncbi:histidine kinase [Listeria cornellensis]|uniref:histidine kinase n=1 Tax=Listeria cornellensis TaxID=1494961 RepID=UPI0004AC7F3E
MTEYVINAQENERKRLSRELHDGLAQGLFSTLIELRKIKYMTKKRRLRIKHCGNGLDARDDPGRHSQYGGRITPIFP